MKYYIIAGEASGDLHGSNLMKGIYAEDPSAEIRFWGGGLMDAVYKEHESGEGLVKDYREGAVLGFVEILLSARTLLKKVKFCEEDILQWKPDVVVLIDYPGFNLRIAEFAHNAGFKVHYYIVPKVWASREGRIAKLKAFVDKLIIVFPFEIPYFESKGVPVTYVGNPLIDAIEDSPAMAETRADFLERTGLPDTTWITLLAGSRGHEIKSMMPVFMELADKWHAAHPQTHFVVAGAPSRSASDYNTGGRDFVHLVFEETYGALRHAQAAVINSGTASLEAALIGTPQVVGYRMAYLTYVMLKGMIKVKFISLANLILDRSAFRELLQDYFTADNLYAELDRILTDSSYKGRMLSDYAEIRRLLGGPGASLRAARAVKPAAGND
ncbi:MAG: lipid-A-disaccharide synthase [Bacteroidales bacterium]|nr:lipid-A-disaccharide synthase [Bacteroidales bacterium]